jgi:hypothetical protein
VGQLPPRIFNLTFTKPCSPRVAINPRSSQVSPFISPLAALKAAFAAAPFGNRRTGVYYSIENEIEFHFQVMVRFPGPQGR